MCFKLNSGEGEVFEYKAPVLTEKPNQQPEFKDLPIETRSACWKQYKEDLKQYKKSLRPNEIKSFSTIPESIRPSYIAVGYPYPNMLAFSLND
jgi:hypothetical protein